MSLLARACVALAATALTAGVVTIAPTGVATATTGDIDGASGFGTSEPQPASQTVRTPKRTTRGAATRAPKRGLGVDIGDIKPLLDSLIVLGGGRPSVSPARPRLLGGGLLGDKTWDDLIKQLSADGLEIRNR
jgi:hypothetical protein